MITVGLIKELLFIAKAWKTDVKVCLKHPKPLQISISHGDSYLDVFYQEEGNDIHIWGETIEGPTSMFGVESCDSISRIVACIENCDESWRSAYYHKEK